MRSCSSRGPPTRVSCLAPYPNTEKHALCQNQYQLYTNIHLPTSKRNIYRREKVHPSNFFRWKCNSRKTLVENFRNGAEKKLHVKLLVCKRKNLLRCTNERQTQKTPRAERRTLITKHKENAEKEECEEKGKQEMKRNRTELCSKSSLSSLAREKPYSQSMSTTFSKTTKYKLRIVFCIYNPHRGECMHIFAIQKLLLLLHIIIQRNGGGRFSLRRVVTRRGWSVI